MFNAKKNRARAQASISVAQLLADEGQLTGSDAKYFQMAAGGKISAHDRRVFRTVTRVDRIATRQNAKTDRTVSRTERNVSAYEHGIDPHAYIGNSLKSVSDAAVGIFGKGVGGPLSSDNDFSGKTSSLGDIGNDVEQKTGFSPVLLLGVAAGLFFFFKRK